MLEPANGSLTVLLILVVVVVIIVIIVIELSIPSCMAGMPVVTVCIVLLAQVPQIGYLAVALVIPSHPGRNALPSMIVSLWYPVCLLSPWLQHLSFLICIYIYIYISMLFWPFYMGKALFCHAPRKTGSKKIIQRSLVRNNSRMFLATKGGPLLVVRTSCKRIALYILRRWT